MPLTFRTSVLGWRRRVGQLLGDMGTADEGVTAKDSRVIHEAI